MANQLQGLNVSWARIFMEIADPGQDAMTYDDAAFDELWEQSNNIRTRLVNFAYATFRDSRSHIVFTTSSAPKSWLSTDGTNELRGDALMAFARFVVSGVLVHKKYGMKADWMELLDDPSPFGKTYVSPDNYVVLLLLFRSILSDRSAGTSFTIPVMGPGLPYLVRTSPVPNPTMRFIVSGESLKTQQPYLAAIGQAIRNGSGPLLDAWSVHAIENPEDATVYNAGDFAARTYADTHFFWTVGQMNSVIPDLPVYVTKFATNATRFSLGIDYAGGASETVEFAMRIVDNICGIVNRGGSAALAWFLNGKYDKKTLYRENGSKRPFRDAFALLIRTIPPSGTIFVNREGTTDTTIDQTSKIFVASNSSFGFVLSRPYPSDGTNGSLSLRVNNANWNQDRYRCTMSLHAYPDHVSVRSVSKTVDAANGVLNISLQRLPYNCVIFGKGDVYGYPLTSALAPTIKKKGVNVPAVSDVSTLASPKEADVVLDDRTGNLMVYRKGIWIPCQIYSENQVTRRDCVQVAR